MDARLRNALVRWLLLASVALGTVVMHHVLADTESAGPLHSAAAAPMTPPPMGQHPVPDPDPQHDVLHMCMAVIQQAGTAVIVLLLLIGVVALVACGRSRFLATRLRAPARPPPGPAGRALLHTVCVARL